MKKEYDFRSYEKEAWIIFISKDERNWWAEKLIGFLQITDENSEEKYWTPAFLDEGYIQSPSNKLTTSVLFGRVPTFDDAVKVMNGNCLDLPEGRLK